MTENYAAAQGKEQRAKGKEPRAKPLFIYHLTFLIWSFVPGGESGDSLEKKLIERLGTIGETKMTK